MEICESLQGTLSMSKTWRILRALIEPDATKTMTQHKLQSLINKYEDPTRLLEDIQNQYIAPKCQPHYLTPNLLWRNCGQRYVNARAIRLLAHIQSLPLTSKTLQTLLVEINQIWKRQALRAEWKLGRMIFIPKPGKHVQLSNPRPITLTSNVGKVMERMVPKQLQHHLESKNSLPHNMIGFRSELSTQDTLL